MSRISESVKHLIIINVLFFIATILLRNKGIDLHALFAMHFPENNSFKPWQVLTHMFMHATNTASGSIYLYHILFNMFGLWMFGSTVEHHLGKAKFLFLYFSAGLGAVLLSSVVDYYNFYALYAKIADLGLDAQTISKIINIDARDGMQITGEKLYAGLEPILQQAGYTKDLSADAFKTFFDLNVFSLKTMVGASGCLMGVMVGFAMLFPNAKLMLIFLPVPIKAKYFIPGIIALDLFSAITGVSMFSPSNTAYFAHIGGALFGFIVMWYFKKNQFKQNRWD